MIWRPIILGRVRQIAAGPTACAAAVLALAGLASLALTHAARSAQRPETAVDALIAGPLSSRIASMRLDQVPLAQAIDALASEAKLRIEVDWPSLAPSGVRPTTPVSLALRGVTLSKAIEIAITRSGTVNGKRGWVPASSGGDIRLVDMRDERYYIERHYPAGDLVSLARNGGDEIKGQVIDLVRNTVAESSWSTDGASGGRIAFEGDVIVVWHTPQVQISVRQLLAKLHPGRADGPSAFCPALFDRTAP